MASCNMAAKENPFSFKAFVTRREKGSEEGDVRKSEKQRTEFGKKKGGRNKLQRATQPSEDVLFPEALEYTSSKSHLSPRVYACKNKP